MEHHLRKIKVAAYDENIEEHASASSQLHNTCSQCGRIPDGSQADSIRSCNSLSLGTHGGDQ